MTQMAHRVSVETRTEIDVEGGLATADVENDLVAPAIMMLAGLIKRSGNIAYQAELGLVSIAWRIIGRLGNEGPMTQSELGEMAQLDKGQLSRALSRLAEEGIIRRERTWRSIELRLAPKGRKVFAAISRVSRLRNETLTAGISKRDLRQFSKTLDRITCNARRLLQPPDTDHDK